MRLKVWLFVAGALLILTGCEAWFQTTPVPAPIENSSSRQIALVPPTLSPAELTPTLAVTPTSEGAVLALDNHSEWKICYVFITPPDANTWGKNWLADGETVLDGATRSFTLKPGTYNLRAEACNFMRLGEQRGFKVQASDIWKVDPFRPLYWEQFDGYTATLQVKGSGAQGKVSAEAYRLRATQPGGLALAQPVQKFDDAIITLAAMPLSLGDVAQVAYGGMCRVQPNGDGYAFLLRGDGWASIQQVKDGKLIALAGWRPVASIVPGPNYNIVEAYCVEDRLTLRINALTVMNVKHNAYTQGDVALAVLGLGREEAEVEFDDWFVVQP